MSGVALSAHAMEAGLKDKPPRARTEPAQPVGWVIWPGPGRGYVVLESDLPALADAMELLWFLRAQQREIELLLAARGQPPPA